MRRLLNAVVGLWRWLLRRLFRYHPTLVLVGNGAILESEKGETYMLLPIDSLIVLDVLAKDAFGNDAAAEDIRVTSENPAVVEVIAIDTNTFQLVSRSVGSTQITVTADALIGEGVETLTKMATVEVVAARAKELVLNLSAPILKETASS